MENIWLQSKNLDKGGLLEFARRVFDAKEFDAMGELSWEYGHYLKLMKTAGQPTEKTKATEMPEPVPGTFWRALTVDDLAPLLEKIEEMILFDAESQIHLLADGDGGLRCSAVSMKPIEGWGAENPGGRRQDRNGAS